MLIYVLRWALLISLSMFYSTSGLEVKDKTGKVENTDVMKDLKKENSQTESREVFYLFPLDGTHNTSSGLWWMDKNTSNPTHLTQNPVINSDGSLSEHISSQLPQIKPSPNKSSSDHIYIETSINKSPSLEDSGQQKAPYATTKPPFEKPYSHKPTSQKPPILITEKPKPPLIKPPIIQKPSTEKPKPPLTHVKPPIILEKPPILEILDQLKPPFPPLGHPKPPILEILEQLKPPTNKPPIQNPTIIDITDLFKPPSLKPPSQAIKPPIIQILDELKPSIIQLLEELKPPSGKPPFEKPPILELLGQLKPPAIKPPLLPPLELPPPPPILEIVEHLKPPLIKPPFENPKPPPQQLNPVILPTFIILPPLLIPYSPCNNSMQFIHHSHEIKPKQQIFFDVKNPETWKTIPKNSQNLTNS